MSECQCPSHGFCETYRKPMGRRQWQICRGEARIADGSLMPAEQRRRYLRNWAKIRDNGGYEAFRPPPGPGTELRWLIKVLSIVPQDGCGCDEMIDQMNTWGVDGCREHRPEIVAHLQEAYDGLTWGEVSKAGARSVTSGLALRLNPLDVCGSLVDEAIRRAS